MTRLQVRRCALAAVAALSLLLAGCALPGVGSLGTGFHGPRSRGDSAATGAPVSPAAPPTTSEEEWAKSALQILQTVDAAVQEYHEATALPAGSPRRRQLQDSAYAAFRRALAEHEALWPVTQQVNDAGLRDQFVFMMGNISGFLNPTPDLPADPPTIGDRIGRSLQNAISTGAAVRPKLERLAAQR